MLLPLIALYPDENVFNPYERLIVSKGVGNASTGPVLFKHRVHEDNDVKCVVCHHKNSNDSREKKCSKCHFDKKGINTIHQICISCHRAKNTGPLTCAACHTARTVGSTENVNKADRADKVDKTDKVDKVVNLTAPDVIALTKTGRTKPQILFNHAMHTKYPGITCVQCHHTGNNVNCSRCHSAKDKDDVIRLKTAFHQQCHDCHRHTSGPKACGRCHSKKYTEGKN
jgi:hypothetical protein